MEMSKVISKFDNEEEIVFNVVQQYLNENKIFERTKLVNFIKSYFSKISVNINEEGIINNLESLIKKRRIVEGSKLTKDSILLNEKRKIIHDFILENPGIIFNKIVKKTEMTNHVVFWHIGMLMKFNIIRKTTINNREIYFNSKLGEEEAIKFYYSSKKESKKILEYLKENRIGVNKATIANDLKMHPKTIKKYITFLEEIGLVDKVKFSEKEILYFLKSN